MAYLLGSIPTGFLVARAGGVDIRKHGSGNIGATNVFRILGKPAGVFVLLADAAKGWYLPFMLLSGISTLQQSHEGFVGADVHSSLFVQVTLIPKLAVITLDPNMENPIWMPLLAGICAILGHNYTCWLRFKGGKGVATTAGVLLAWTPGGFGIALGVWLLVFAVSRYVSLASIVAALSLPVATWLSGGSTAFIIVTALLGALAVYKHRDNIKRLLNGTEHRFGQKKQQPTDAAK